MILLMQRYDPTRSRVPACGGLLLTGQATMSQYDHKRIEKKWQRVWAQQKLYQARDGGRRKKYYALIEFPYPSGDGLHVGHPRPYIGMDVIARKRRMEGYNVLYPIGWDAFGLPTENYALKTGIHPATVTKRNTKNFKRQIQSLGISFDWSREINTTDPAYYRWTQWIFLQFFKHGLAYKKKMPINWCLSCKIGLANEEVVDGKCERCGGETEKREKEQWMLAITKYADRLDKDLDLVDYAERIKVQQRNWIGRSEGLLFTAPVKGTDLTIQTFSAHFEAFYADTFVVIAPDHPRLPELVRGLPQEREVRDFADALTEKRTRTGREATDEPEGIFTGRYIVDPVGNGDLPIWVANFAIADYGTGIVKASAHDERDFAFAKKYGIRLKPVIFPENPEERKRVENLEVCFSDMQNGILAEPPEFSGKRGSDSRSAIADYAVRKGFAERKVSYKLRDWVFSRQRYWGEPIPLIYCQGCGVVPVPEKDLPVKLPTVTNYKPTDTGESPLAAIEKWVNVKCPRCGGAGRRETDTMPNWAGSSWYYLRYTDPDNSKAFAGKRKLAYWCSSKRASDSRYENQMLVEPKVGPVDWYNGGMEHTTLHLLYSRFWHKFLHDQKLVPTPEPYAKRTSHGLILAEGGEKMSKSKGNVVNPDDIVGRFGADSLRVYEMFMGPFEQAIAWSTDSLVGARRFLERVWRLRDKSQITSTKLQTISNTRNSNLQTLLHQTIKKVGEDIECMKFNTAVSTLMILVNALEKETAITPGDYETLLTLLAPFAPHIVEELFSTLGHRTSIHAALWPAFDEELARGEWMTVIVQVNGKTRGSFNAERGLSDEEMRAHAASLPAAGKWIQGKEIKKVIVVKDRLVNIVVSSSPHE